MARARVLRLRYLALGIDGVLGEQAGPVEAVRVLYEQLMDAWNKGDGDAYAAVFAEDGDLIGFDGTHCKGRQEVAPFHQRLFETHLKGTRLVGQARSRESGSSVPTSP